MLTKYATSAVKQPMMATRIQACAPSNHADSLPRKSLRLRRALTRYASAMLSKSKLEVDLKI
jgi:hypothetical protein